MRAINVEIESTKVYVVPRCVMGESETLAAIVPRLAANEFQIQTRNAGLVCPYLPLNGVGTKVILKGDEGEPVSCIEIEIGSYGAVEVGQFANRLGAVYDEVFAGLRDVSLPATIRGVIAYSHMELPSALREGTLRIGASEIADARTLEFKWHEDDTHCTVLLCGTLSATTEVAEILDELWAFRESLREYVVPAFGCWASALHDLDWHEPSKSD